MDTTLNLFSHEAFLAGALLIDAENTLREMQGVLTAENFKDPIYRAIYETAAKLQASGEHIDCVVILEAVNRLGAELTNQDVLNLMKVVPSLAAVPAYVERIAAEDDAEAMRLMFLDAYCRLSDGEGQDTVRDEVAQKLQNMRSRSASALVNSGEAIKECYDGLVASSAGEKLFVGTGYGRLNKILGSGLIKSGLHILAARPGTGKTTLALQIAENVAAKGIKTLFVTLEMSVDQLQHRRLALDAGLPLGDILSITQDNTEVWRKLNESAARLSARPLLFNRIPSLSVQRIERLARSAEAGFLVIDYLGLISHGTGKSIYERVTETSNALKRMAVSLGIPVLCLCQLNREADGREPQLSELRDSGAIEQDADTVLLQWLPGGRPEDDGRAAYDPVELQVLVKKNRHGAQGKASLEWYMQCGRIRE